VVLGIAQHVRAREGEEFEPDVGVADLTLVVVVGAQLWWDCLLDKIILAARTVEVVARREVTDEIFVIIFVRRRFLVVVDALRAFLASDFAAAFGAKVHVVVGLHFEQLVRLVV
jgi:hypothetical protein